MGPLMIRFNIEVRNLSSVLGCLGVVEVGGHSDDSLGHGLSEISFLRLTEHEGSDLRVLLTLSLNPVVGLDDLVRKPLDVVLSSLAVVAPADESLSGEQCVLRVGHSLSLGGNTNESLAVVRERNIGRVVLLPSLFYDSGVGGLHDGDAGV